MKEQILSQLEISWQLFLYHMESIEDTEALWVASPQGLKIKENEGVWVADWPETEEYEIGPSSIAWTMWHIIYWWSATFKYNFESVTLEKEEVVWPGNVHKAKKKIISLHDGWVELLNSMEEVDFLSEQHAKWPFVGKTFADIALWLNVELMKNASEIGYGRYLYAIGEDLR